MKNVPTRAAAEGMPEPSCTPQEVDRFLDIYRRLDSYGRHIIECMIWIMSGTEHRLEEYDNAIVADARERVTSALGTNVGGEVAL